MRQGEKFPADSALRHIDVEFIGEDGLITGLVAAEYIRNEDMPVNDARVYELHEDMAQVRRERGGTGQDSPITLGEVPGITELLTIDGFHRYKSFLAPDAPKLRAVTLPGLTMEQLLDKRVRAATVHSDVSFARSVQSIEAAWQLTEWADTLTASRAFAMAHNDSSYTRDADGKHIRLDAESIDSIKGWAWDKAELWQIPVVTILRRLALAEKAEPGEVAQVRAKERSGATRGILTDTILQTLTTNFPDNPSVRHRLEKLIPEHDLDAIEVRTIIDRLQEAKATTVDATEAVLLDPHLISSIRKSNKLTSPPRGKRKPRINSRPTDTTGQPQEQITTADDTVLTEFLQDEIELAHLSLQALILKGVYVSDRLPTASSKKDASVPVDASTLLLERSTLKALSVASQRRKHEVRVRFEDRRSAIVERLRESKSKQTASHAAGIADMVKKRLASDSRSGGLHFAEATREEILDSLIINCLQDEVLIHGKEVPDFRAPVPHPIDGQALVEAFPKIERGVRRMLILRSVFNLSPFVVAQAVGQEARDIDPTIITALKRT